MRYEPQALVWALLVRNVVGFAAAKNAPDAFYSTLRPCPAACDGSPQNWTVYTSLKRLEVCTEPMLLDFAIYNPLEDPKTTTKLRTCTSGDSKDNRNGLLSETKTKSHKRDIKYTFKKNACITAAESKVDLDLAISVNQGHAGIDNLQAAFQNVRHYIQDAVHCNTKFLVGYSQGAAVAVYSGAAIDNSRTVPSVLQQMEKRFQSASPSNAFAELCSADRNADYTFGVAIDTTGDIAAVQKAVASWANGTCFGDGKSSSKLSGVSIFEAPLIPIAQSGTGKKSTTNVNSAKTLNARGDCSTITVVAGDGCDTLATKCGISAQDLSKFNPSPTLCSGLQPGERICCTAGTLPDLTPKPNPDGSCAKYTIQPNDFCAQIAAANSLTVDQLEAFNDKTTWGWNGCNDLAAGINICLSTGSPPLPAPIPNSVCGPVVPGSAAPKAGQALGDLNPCPLNTCCDVWGQCGITPEYCTPEQGPTGNPGTAPPGHNGCVSNCGTDIKNNGAGPSSFMKVTYYESWAWDRPCLHYATSDLSSTDYTHVHWGFATIDSNFNVVIDDPYNQLPSFLSLPQKKIVSFGGWGYSTDPATYEILRSAMTPQNVDTFVSNIAAVLRNGWDGVDIDWEYPGAPDIPGIPPGLASDGPNYLAFLTKLRAALGSSKSISIAAPASYWYLKSFPVADMAQQLDYVVYMTYDLHGQWDYNNQFSQEGCPAGNCLRSHVNLTETMYALSMITKAGVPSNKINVGVSSYGRSFGLTNPAACQGSFSNPGCTFVGPDSGATPGVCTNEAGYIANAEIDQLLGSGQYVFDTPSDSDMLFYGNNWVAYMSDLTKSSRTSKYKGLNFAGTVDWAVDLQKYTVDSGSGGSGGDIIHYPPSIWQNGNPSITCDDCTIVLPPSPLATPITVTYTVYTSILVSQPGTTATEQTSFVLPPFTISSVPFWPITIHPGAQSTTFTPLQSIMPPSTVISLPSSVVIAPPRSGTYLPFATVATPTAAPGPHPSNTIQDCSQWYQDADGDTCASIAQKFDISQSDFKQWNPSLGSSCSLIVGDYYFSGGGGGSFPPPPGPPPPPPPPTDDDNYKPPVADCQALTGVPIVPPPFSPPSDPTEHESGPADTDSNHFDNQNPPTTTAKPTSSSPPHATTITTNGMACTLISGSNNPVCTPIATPSPNPAGTNVHVNKGCVLINGSPRCSSDSGPIANVYQNFYNVASTQGQASSTALILYGYDSSDPYSTQQKATCQMNARWPSNYGDVFLGEDGYLYDAGGNKIFDQHCSTPDVNNQGPTINPYRDPRPAASCKREDDVIAIGFTIRAKDWITDGGAALKKQVQGCGAVTLWQAGTDNEVEVDGSFANIGSFRADFAVSFALPITFKTGCVGRAIGSAGGPQGNFC
ncbi:hypothetical protein TrVFT333_002345 [Trichoderma virens FT-333]|nr:hypothetical protein TrVFT333_002345 [Trichoderma virens FT-333]